MWRRPGTVQTISASRASGVYNPQTVEQRLVQLVASYDGVAFIPGITDYSDAAGTIPAQVGDQVAYVRCAAGSGKIVQFPSSHRPVLQQSANGSYYYDPNGVECYGVTDCSGTGVAEIYMCGAGQSTGNGKVYAGCFKAPNNRMYMGVSDGLTAGKIGAGVDGVSWNTLYADAEWSSATVVSVQRTADTATLSVNGETVDTAAISGVGSELPAYVMALNNDGTAIDFWNSNWYGLVGILDIVSDADALTIETDFATIAQVPTVVSFTSVGSTTWTAPARTTSVTYLVAGGGGGAGNGYDNAGGGGGGAGMVLTGTLSVTPGQTYTVTVGDGGAGGADTRTNNPGTAGNNSVFATITALGGGQGLGSRTGGAVGAAQISDTTAPTGGSGSGGGFGGKGGGGATGAGSANSGATGGNGGAGTSSSITGSSVTYGIGGAGGGAGAPTTDGSNGTANRGNGGQGGKSDSADSAKGGNGGSGIVVLSFNQ